MSEVFWIEGNPAPGLAIVERPDGDHRLEKELRHLRRDGIDTLVSMLPPDEAEMLGLGEESEIAAEVGLKFLSFPIRDAHVPPGGARFPEFAADLATRLAAGEKIGIHCRGSIGRATVAGACALIHRGWDPREALEAIAVARGYAVPDTLEQEDWILAYQPKP